MHLRHPIQWDSPEYPPRPVCTFRTAHRVYQNDGRMLPQNGQLDNPLFEIFYRKVCGDALHHEEVTETTRCAGICRGSTAAFRLCNGAKFVYNEENEKLAPRTGRRRSRKRPARAERRCGRKARRGRNVGAAEKQTAGGMSERRKSKRRAERRRGRKARRGRDAEARESKARTGCGGAGKNPARAERRGGGKANRRRDAKARESKAQAGCGDAGKQGEGGMSGRRESKARAERRRGGKARRERNVGAVGKQGEGGMSGRRKSKPQAGCGDGRKESPGTR